ncbi:chromosome segregation ATPase [Rhodococcus sp. PvR044]|uniref:hypothetical protein n=1 Tax=unclassified Rhodococcus (in: high G+C Gram-positive bacteria) TaxID=192944 RepID=UPI000BC61FF5|nr:MULTISPECIES: hypothetical protein [unclassified Rhodococcus (in: high G+C Gram-positive bacteria)]MBP1158776.1 chromosome segregation ATPase [Rhodococcus sp. PvR099]PTR45373.1 hypothetical protein C8K38_101100 [Rhodococcus sp. OK611]SNX88923.1 hypothetical protein SAMN05447004_101100 [Rhodococcus sp. OK270]
MNTEDEKDAETAEEPKVRPGRPRQYASDADRVRAFRSRRKAREQQGELDALANATPSEVVGVLERTLEDLRTVTANSIEQFNVFARQITAAVDKLSDPDALDVALHRATVELAQTKAKYETDLAELRTRHEAAVEDRVNAEATVDAVDAELSSAVENHRLELERLSTDHQAELRNLEQTHAGALRAATERVAAVEADRDTRLSAAESDLDDLRGRFREAQSQAEAAERRAAAAEQSAAVSEQRAEQAGVAAEQRLEQVVASAEQRIADMRAAGELAANTAAATIARLEKSVDHERSAASSARERADTLRDDLERARLDTGEARTAEAALREKLEELRPRTLEGEPAETATT